MLYYANYATKSGNKILENESFLLITAGWDQSDKFMKIYVTLDGVQNIAKENVTCQFTDG